MFKSFFRYWVIKGILFLTGVVSAQENSIVLQDIHISGLEKTKSKVILRELPFSIADTLSPSEIKPKIKLAQENIYNLGLFNKVIVKDSLKNDSFEVYIEVKERWYVWPIAILRLEERTFNEWWIDKDLDRLVYGVGVDWSNFSGSNDKLLIWVQGGYAKGASLLYLRPFLFPKAKIDGSFSFIYVNNKEIGYSTEQGVLQLARLQNSPMRVSYTAQALFSKRFSPRKNIKFGVQYDYFRPSDSIRYFNDQYLTSNKNVEYYPSIIVSYLNDQRDIRYFPLNGYKHDFRIQQTGMKGLSTTSFMKISGSVSYHKALKPWLNIAYGTENHLLLGDQVPYFDKQFIGFGAMIRGYEAYVVDGALVHISKAEIKWGIVPRRIVHIKKIPFQKFQDFPIGVYISMFSDMGYAHDYTFNNQDNYLKDRLLHGYGVGLNLLGPYDSMARIELSRNNLGQTGIYLHGILAIR